jgi:hypothetical protein
MPFDLCQRSASRVSSKRLDVLRTYSRNLIILAGSWRQDSSPTPVPSGSPSPPEGGILARYQLLTPALITSLLVVFLVFGVSALARIQSPLRVQPPKGYSADEKNKQPVTERREYGAK